METNVAMSLDTIGSKSNVHIPPPPLSLRALVCFIIFYRFIFHDHHHIHDHHRACVFVF